MKSKTLVAAALLCFSLQTAAQITTVQRAHEVALKTVRLPESVSGTIAFKSCSSCDYQTERVTPETRWVVNGNAMEFEKFKETIDGLANKNKYITVKHHLENDVITRVSIRID